MQTNPVVWFEIYVQGMERARSFYENVLSVSLTKLEHTDLDMWAFPMETAGATGALVHMPGFESGANSVLVYFSCEDCAVQAVKAASLGGTIVKEKFSIGVYGFIALVTDTEGNMIGLHSTR